MKRWLFVILALVPTLALAVTLEWDMPAVSEGDLAGFNVYRSMVSGQRGSLVAQIPATNTAGGEHYIVPQPDPAAYGVYFYVVTARDTTGNESPPSNEARLDFFDNVAPGAPANLTVRR